MKKILLSILLLQLNIIAFCQVSPKSGIVFSFPFSQDDKEWCSFRTPKDRISALQIPENILQFVCTKNLLDCCLNFPYITDAFANSNMESGFNGMMSEFNGFRELLNRKDAIDALVDEFEKLPDYVYYMNDKSEIENGNYSIKFIVLCYLLDHRLKKESVYNETLRQTSDINMTLMKKNPHVFGELSIKVVQSIINKLRSQVQMSPRAGNELYSTQNQYQYLTRTTPNGSNVTVGILTSADYSSAEKLYLRNQICQNYNVEFIDDATLSYNCHGYAWHMYEGNLTDKVWIGVNSTDEEDIYWEDGSYYEVPESLATKVSYQGDHSAVRLNSTEYLSKWGALPLVKHAPTEVPSSYGFPNKFYKRYIPVLITPLAICDRADISVNILPSEMSIIWSVSGGISLSSGQGTNTITVTKVSDGLGSVTAQIYKNSNLIKTLTASNIPVGKPSIGMFAHAVDPSGNPETWAAHSGNNTFVIDTDVNIAYRYYETYLYDPSGNLLWHGQNQTNNMGIPCSMNAGWHHFMIRGYSRCGYSNWYHFYILVTENYQYSSDLITLDYDSGSEVVTITLNLEDKESNASSSAIQKKLENDSYTVQLWNNRHMIKSISTEQNVTQFSLVGVEKGIYIVRVIKDGKNYGKKFSKK